MAEATKQEERQNQSRISRLRNALTLDCPIPSCTWYNMAIQVLNQNGINPYTFAHSMRTLIDKGRGKYRNIMLCGPYDCAKSFLLAPLSEIYDKFKNPSSGRYALVGAQKRR